MAKKKQPLDEHGSATLTDHPVETFYPSEVVDIDSLKPWPTNYNEHSPEQVGSLGQSIGTFGQFKNVVVWKEYIVAGHGLIEGATKRGWRRIEVKRLPADWTESQVEAVLIADNRLPQLSTPNEEKLAAMLQRVRLDNATLLDSVGYNSDEVDAMLRGLAQAGEPGAGGEGLSDGTYTNKITSPIYRATGPKPPISDLFDDSRTKALERAILSATGISDEERKFLLLAAQRHTVLNFSKVAEYYAHSNIEMQDLMEDSALVIIDFNKAIELGYVRLAEKIAALYGDDYGQ